MFDAVIGIKFGYVLCGVIWAIVMGFAAGNYACSLVHRLPRGRLILDKKPYCGHCGEPLQVRDLFPVVSALLLHHRCRYCHTPYPVSHTWTEVLVGLLFVLAFLDHNFGQNFLLIIFIGIFLITLAAIEANEGMVMGKILLCVMVPGMIYRTLQDGTIYNFFDGGLWGLVIGALVWRKRIKPMGHIFILPTPAILLALGGICVGGDKLPLFFVLFAVFYGADWLIRSSCGTRSVSTGSHVIDGDSAQPHGGSQNDKPLITVSFGLAVILPVLYPKLSLLALL